MARVGFGLVYATPEIITTARKTWLPPDSPHLAIGDETDKRYNLRQIKEQIAEPGRHNLVRPPEHLKLLGDGLRMARSRLNHRADNRPLALIRLANQSLDVDWLVVGDADTCFNVSALQSYLSQFDPKRRSFLGLPVNDSPETHTVVKKSAPLSLVTSGQQPRGFQLPQIISSGRSSFPRVGRTPSGCGAMSKLGPLDRRAPCCSVKLMGMAECRPKTRWSWHPYFGRQYFYRPNRWPFGGAGYVLSRALLHSISQENWTRCEREMLRDGGDVRVAACIYSFSGIGLTYLPGLLGNLSSHREPCHSRL